MQVPDLSRVTVAPETPQTVGVSDRYDAVSPELVVALTVKAASP